MDIEASGVFEEEGAMRRIAGIAGTWAVGLALAAAAACGQVTADGQAEPAEPARLADEAPRVADRPEAEAVAEAPRKPDDEEKARKLDAILERWRKQSAAITRLDASFRRIQREKARKDVSVSEGRVLLKGTDLFCMDLVEIVRNPDPKAGVKKRFFGRFVSTGKEIVSYGGETKTIYVVPWERAKNPEDPRPWPIPFLIDVKPEQFKARFRVELLQEARDACRIEITPREAEEVADDGPSGRRTPGHDTFGVNFSSAIIDLRRDSSLPDALQLTSIDGKETQTYVFKDYRVNESIPAENFTLKKLEGWKIVRLPVPDPKRDVARTREAAAAPTSRDRARPR